MDQADDDVPGVAEEAEDEEVEEGRRPKIQCSPHRPTQADIAEHECTHWPFRSWCRHCVRGRAVSSPHKRRTTEEVEFSQNRVPTISVDHCFMSAASEASSEHPFLVLYDNNTGSIYAFATGTKAMKPWVIGYVHSIICELGYGGVRIAFKSDRAAELIQLRQEVARLRTAPTVPILSATKESKSNGDMERAVRTWQGQYRTLKMQVEEMTGSDLPSGHVALQWCAWWAAGILSRFRVRPSGRTPYETTTGHKSKVPIACFGEHILWQSKRVLGDIGKAESEWYDGIYLGMSGSSSYTLVGTSNGIERTTSFRRHPKGQQWSRELLDQVNTTLEEYIDPTTVAPHVVIVPQEHVPLHRIPEPEDVADQVYR